MTEEQKSKILARLKIMIPEENASDSLLSQLIDDAEAFVLAYTNRSSISDILLKSVGDLAIVAYNRLGTEGESGRTEGGESYSFESAPDYIFSALKSYRIARCGGNANTPETTEAE